MTAVRHLTPFAIFLEIVLCVLGGFLFLAAIGHRTVPTASNTVPPGSNIVLSTAAAILVVVSNSTVALTPIQAEALMVSANFVVPSEVTIDRSNSFFSCGFGYPGIRFQGPVTVNISEASMPGPKELWVQFPDPALVTGISGARLVAGHGTVVRSNAFLLGKFYVDGLVNKASPACPVVPASSNVLGSGLERSATSRIWLKQPDKLKASKQ